MPPHLRLFTGPACAAIILAAVAAAGPFTPLDTATRHGGVETTVGVGGPGVILDGFSGWLDGPAAAMPKLTGSLTVSVWFAPGAYPLREAPILDTRDDTGGFTLGLDSLGRPTFTIRAGEAWHTLVGPDPLALMQWHHLVAVWRDGAGPTLYVNGAAVVQLSAAAPHRASSGADWLIGRSRDTARPDGAIRLEANANVRGMIDGALAALVVSPEVMDAPAVAALWAAEGTRHTPPLAPRVLPAGPPGPGPFGAFPTELHYFPQWDRAWRTGPHADVVVRFDEMPGRFVFWRGTSYIPHWVTENGIWYTNEFNETWGDMKGCGEPMSDKQCRYSRIAVIESGPARAVVHWRYALTDVFYDIARVDPDTGWGDWTDEVYTIYPDGTALREITLHTTQPDAPHEWHEAIVVMGPGLSPEQCLEPEALTVIGSSGPPVTFSWRGETPPAQPLEPADCVIQMVNTRSRYRPFAIVRPQDRGSFGIFAKEVRRDVSIFPWWNHWPAAQSASDGRYAFAADRPSHSSLSNIAWGSLAEGPGWQKKIMLTGLTDQPVESLRSRMLAWSNPPTVVVNGGDGTATYDPAQMAWIIEAPERTAGGAITLAIAASENAPLENPAFILRDHAAQLSRVTLDGLTLQATRDFRQHVHQQIDGAHTVLWLKLSARAPKHIELFADSF